LEKYFDVPRPWDFARTDLVQVVLQTNSGECVASSETEETTSGGGDGGGASAGGSAGGVLCFTESALVAMADGSYQRIADVVVGEYVRTGTDQGQGLVTAVLHHPVAREVPVVVHVTEKYGALVGTPDHPVLLIVDQDDEKEQWVAFGSLDDGATVRFEEHYYVETFYNLEIDGDQPGSSSHSYVVNGIIASGLGDNPVLNTLFPRQQEASSQVAAVSSTAQSQQ
jgi:Hint-domain